MAKQKVKTISKDVKTGIDEKKKIEFYVTEENVNIIDNFFKVSLQSHAQRVLDYEKAFFKSLQLIKDSLIRREV